MAPDHPGSSRTLKGTPKAEVSTNAVHYGSPKKPPATLICPQSFAARGQSMSLSTHAHRLTLCDVLGRARTPSRNERSEAQRAPLAK